MVRGDAAMTILTVRNLKPEVHQRLREQAAAHGRSMEAEARAILEAAVAGNEPDVMTALRTFVADVQPTQAELEIVFPGRNPEEQRPVTLGNDAR